MSTSVVAGSYAPPVLEFSEHVFDFVALAIEGFVVFDWLFAAFGRRDARLDAPVEKGLAEPVAVIAFVTNQAENGWQGVDHEPSALVVAHLPLTQKQDERAPFAIADRVQL